MKLIQLSKLALASAAALTIATAASAKITRVYQETIDLEGIKEVKVHISAGNIDIVGTDRSDLDLHLEQIFRTNSESKVDELEPEIERTIERKGDTLHITVKKDRDGSFIKSLFSDDVGIYFHATIELPYQLSVDLHTNGGNIDGNHIAGETEVKTNGGNITLNQILGPLEAKTNGGNIRVSDLHAPAEIKTNGGNIEITAHASEIDAHTNGGNIHAYLHEGITGRTKFETNGGSVHASMPSGAAFDLEAKASGGSVNLKYDGQFKGEVSKHKVDAAINQGGPLLSMKTAGGNVTLKNL